MRSSHHSAVSAGGTSVPPGTLVADEADLTRGRCRRGSLPFRDNPSNGELSMRLVEPVSEPGSS